MISLSQLKRLPLSPYPKFDWHQLGDNSYGGGFYGTPDEMLSVMKTFFRRGTVKRKKFPAGNGYLLTSALAEECNIRPSKKAGVTVIEIYPSSKSEETFQFAVRYCQKAMFGKGQILEPSSHMTTCSFPNPISQKSWNREMKQIGDGWKPIYVKITGFQIMRKDGVDIQYNEHTKRVTILWNR